MNSEKKDIIKSVVVWTAGCVAFITGIVLTVWGFIKPPEGEISGSVLAALGEFLTFAGSVFGIGGYTAIKLRQLDNERRRLTNESKA